MRASFFLWAILSALLVASCGFRPENRLLSGDEGADTTPFRVEHYFTATRIERLDNREGQFFRAELTRLMAVPRRPPSEPMAPQGARFLLSARLVFANRDFYYDRRLTPSIDPESTTGRQASLVLTVYWTLYRIDGGKPNTATDQEALGAASNFVIQRAQLSQASDYHHGNSFYATRRVRRGTVDRLLESASESLVQQLTFVFLRYHQQQEALQIQREARGS